MPRSDNPRKKFLRTRLLVDEDDLRARNHDISNLGLGNEQRAQTDHMRERNRMDANDDQAARFNLTTGRCLRSSKT